MFTKQKTEQEMFDHVVKHMLTQMSHAFTRRIANCRYYGENGKKGPVGCLIAEEHYDTSMEGLCPSSGNILNAVELSGWPANEEYLVELQRIHDRGFPEFWEEWLREFAAKHSFAFNPPNR